LRNEKGDSGALKGKNSKWRFAIDRGGTFTDVVGLDPYGDFHTLKLLSSSSDYEDPSIEGIRRVLGVEAGKPLPKELIHSIRFGTTAATNALLERKGGRVALFITKGFRDLLRIGYQSRPDIFSLCIQRPSRLYTEVFEVEERIGPDGRVVKEIDLNGLEQDIEKIKEGVDAVSVVFMHSWKDPRHECLCEEVLKRHNITNVFLSHRTVNLIKIVTRGQSTMVDAYLSPVMASYFEGIKKETGKVTIEFIQSSGTLTPPGSFKGKGALFSGPAGGVTAVGEVARETELKGAIGLDMGGTSTDVSRYDGGFEKVYEQTVGGIEIQGEALNIVTVASGGGSKLWFDGQRMRVGPESAGAFPGPASYGFGGPITVTDANLFTGRIAKEYFPRTFGPRRDSHIDVEVVKDRFADLRREIKSSTNKELTPEEIALGFLQIANGKMALAIKQISVSRGFDVRDYALISFGGAGGQHACSIAELLGIKKIIFHPLSGLMSAYGIGLSRPAERSLKTVLMPYDGKTHKKLSALFKGMEMETVPERWQGEVISKMEIDLRPMGADTYLTVEFTGYEATVERFRNRYKMLFGFFPEDTPIEAVNLRLEVQEAGIFFPSYKTVTEAPGEKPEPLAYQEIIYPGGPVDRYRAPVYSRSTIPPSFRVKGPAIVVDRYSTLVIDPGFEGELSERGFIVLERVSKESKPAKLRTTGPDPVLLEVFNNLFMSVATEMGYTLKNTAHSVNIKERLDFSCAVFDSKGELVANAHHIPVHLGAMSGTVKAIIEDKRKSMKPGDIYLSNNPYRGGSHLPDLTVVEPVFSLGGEIIFFVASRGHHADIGGKTPGSLPPTASHIDEEGVLIDGVLILRDGKFREKELIEILSKHRYPARNMEERISDLRAQMASCRKGRKELEAVIDRHGWDTVKDYMGYVQKNAEYAVKKALFKFLGGKDKFEAAFEDSLDDGTQIKVMLTITAGTNPPETLRAKIDFTGTGPQHTTDNLNAPLPVTRSAVLYVLRTITEEDIPLNSGCLKPVDIIVPAGTLLNPSYPAPVGSGNVETSQRVVDVLLGSLGIAAASQGTMNNLLFEVEDEVPYYETIAGGSGATGGCPGASGVQVHMTNTRITDPEILEFRHPGIRLERFGLRKGSGGKGLYPGGDGVVREIKFLKPAKVSVITERRVHAPYGMAGGGCGKRGENLLKEVDGRTIRLGQRSFLEVNKGESIIIKTPGGGGYGKK
jgi:5-oxoprolinase (ATP-hydrolysing)